MNQKSKCLHCKYYMKIEYVNSVNSDSQVHCLKLKANLGNAKIVTVCNQFKPIK